MGGLGGNTLLFAGTAIASVGADQVTKIAIVNSLQKVRIVHAGPTFVAMSIRQGILAWFAAFGCLVLTIVLGTQLPTLSVVGVGLVVGGAAGNLVDRLVRGGVVDFIAIGRWTTFNVADAAMVAGVGLSVWGLS